MNEVANHKNYSYEATNRISWKRCVKGNRNGACKEKEPLSINAAGKRKQGHC